jgi:hypothetical protein
LTKGSVVCGNGRDFFYSRSLVDNVLDLNRGYVDAAGNKDVLEAIDERHIAEVIQDSKVAGI